MSTSCVHAAQLIYTRLTRGPRAATPGYQTLCWTVDAISPQTKREIEAAIFYSGGSGAPIKHTFGTTCEGQFVVTRVCALTDLDEHHRLGGFLAHALVFSPAEFAGLENNPFAVFDTFAFCESIAQAEATVETSPGSARPAVIPVPPSHGPERFELLAGMPDDHFRTLLLLADSETPPSPPCTVGLYGPTATAYAFLRELFGLLPEAMRAHVTFDTYFVGRSPAKASLWAVGLPSLGMRYPTLLPLMLNNLRFQPAVKRPPANAFQAWVVSRPTPYSLPADCERIDAAFHLSGLLRGWGYRTKVLARVDDELADEFTRVSADLVWNLIRKQLHAQCGDSLGSLVEPAVRDWLDRDCPGRSRIELMQDGFQPERLCDWSAQSLAHTKICDIPDGVIADLERFLAEQAAQLGTLESHFLRISAKIYRREWSDLRRHLKSTSAGVRKKFLEQLLTTCQVRAPLVAMVGESWLAIGTVVQGEDWDGDVLRGYLACALGVPQIESVSPPLAKAPLASRHLDEVLPFASKFSEKDPAREAIWATYSVARDEEGFFFGVCFQARDKESCGLLRSNLSGFLAAELPDFATPSRWHGPGSAGRPTPVPHAEKGLWHELLRLFANLQNNQESNAR
jgi:hypothetical protein